MKKIVFIGICAVLLFSGCAHEFNKVYRTSDYDYKYEYAKECFAAGKYSNAIALLQELVTIKKGSEEAEECLYMLAMAQYGQKDYEAASETFKKYFQTYPQGMYAEMASFYIGQSLYMGTPEPRLDQSETIAAIAAFQDYLDVFHDAKLKGTAQQRLFDLQDKLVRKEYLTAKPFH